MITSDVFSSSGEIPSKYTCEGDDISPPLRWAGVPEGTRSLALIADDPDAPDPAAPQRVYVHWVLYGIPASATGLPEGVTSEHLPRGAREG
jgi:Raf kinase inhibitor-like YbhB/YbcL family protein